MILPKHTLSIHPGAFLINRCWCVSSFVFMSLHVPLLVDFIVSGYEFLKRFGQKIGLFDIKRLHLFCFSLLLWRFSSIYLHIIINKSVRSGNII